MKPTYDSYKGKWKVKGLGWFDSAADAWREIERKELKTPLLICISKEMKAKLEEASAQRKTTISEIVRNAIRKEVGL